jgi:hypothetical protein
MYESVRNNINKNLEKNRFSQREVSNVDLVTFLEFHYEKYLPIKNYLMQNFS